MHSFSKAITCGEEAQEELLLHMPFTIVINEAMGYGGFIRILFGNQGIRTLACCSLVITSTWRKNRVAGSIWGNYDFLSPPRGGTGFSN